MKISSALFIACLLILTFSASAQTTGTKDTAQYKIAYAILKPSTWEVAYSPDLWQDLTKTLGLKSTFTDADYFKNLFKAFDYLNTNGYELVSESSDRYTFVRKRKNR